jgi:hypothetical protein
MLQEDFSLADILSLVTLLAKTIGHISGSRRHRWILVLTSILYVFSFSLSLVFPNAFFWDDWINYFDKSAPEIRSSQAFSGFSPPRLVIEGWLAEHWISGFHIIQFILFPIAAVALSAVLKQLKFLTASEKIVVSSLFLLLPVNSARNSMTLLMYTSCYASFFVGWWLYSLKPRLTTDLFALLLFLYSFDTASLMLFMVIPISVSLLNFAHEGMYWRKWLLRNSIFVVAPLSFWFLEPILNPTLDLVRAQYWTPKWSGIARGLVLLLVILLIGLFGFKFRNWKYSNHRGQIQIFVGLILTWIAVFPYMTVGHFPNLESFMISFVPGNSDWDSRHQLLMPLGLAIILLGILNYFEIEDLTRVLIPLLVTCAVLNFTFTQEYYIDSAKSSAILRQFAEQDKFSSFERVLVEDRALRFNARGRSIRTYEWDVMLNQNDAPKKITSEVSRFIDCENFSPQALVIISADRGKLMTLLTRDPALSVSVNPISICN